MKNGRRILSMLLAVLMLTTSLSISNIVSAFAADTATTQQLSSIASADEEDGIIKTFEDSLNYYKMNGQVFISSCKVSGEYVVIPETIEGLPVTTIATGAFYGSMARVYIPSSVTTIEDGAFTSSGVHIFYPGTSSQWKSSITIGTNNDIIYTGTRHYNVADANAYTSVVTAPTCTAQGYTTFSCTLCDDTYKAHYTEKTAHNIKDTVVEPTCMAQGYTLHSCVDCTYSYEDTYTNIVHHKLTEGECEYCNKQFDVVESEHNYAENTDYTWYVKKPFSTSITLEFSADTEVEENYDRIYIYNGIGTLVGEYTGKELASKSITVSGHQSLSIRLVTDDGENRYGFKATVVAKYDRVYFKNTINFTGIYLEAYSGSGVDYNRFTDGGDDIWVCTVSLPYRVDGRFYSSSNAYTQYLGPLKDGVIYIPTGEYDSHGYAIVNAYDAADYFEGRIDFTPSTDDEAEEDITIPSEPAVTEPYDPTNKIYFKDALGWGTVYAYMWGNAETGSTSTEITGEWPGVHCYYEGNNIWSVDMSAYPTPYNVIFNNGGTTLDGDGQQTDDQEYPGTGKICIPTNELVSGDYGYYYVANWHNASDYVEIPTQVATDAPETTAPEAETTAPEELLTIYFDNNQYYWSNVYCHSWNLSGSDTEWPGTLMERIGGNIYRVSVPSEHDYIIFNNGNTTQLDEIEIAGSNMIYSYGVWNVYNDNTEDSTDVATDPVETTAEVTEENTTAADDGMITIYFVKPSDWEGAYLYSFYGVGNTMTTEWSKAYPGNTMEFVETDANGNDIYRGDVPADIDVIKFADGSTINRRTDIIENFEDGICFCLGENYSPYKWYVTEYDYIVGGNTPTQVATDPTELETTEADPVETSYTYHDTEPATAAPSTRDEEETATVYFSNNRFWSTVNIYYWGNGYNVSWPGIEMSYVRTNDYSEEVYKVEIPTGVEGFLFNGATTSAYIDAYYQTVDIEAPVVNNRGYYTTDMSADGSWMVGYYSVAPEVPEVTTEAATEDEESTAAPSTRDEENTTPTEPETTVPEIKEDNYYSVVFLDYNGKFISAQTVKQGEAAAAPEAPARTGYTFTGWDREFTNVTSDLKVTAQYKRNYIPEATATEGVLNVEVIGGSSFKISVNGGALRPQGPFYKNTKMAIGATVTLVASASADNAFIGWMNSSGAIVSTDETYTFTTSGDDNFKAMYQAKVEGISLVTFNNTKAAGGNGQILDMQYYAAGDEIVIPDDPKQTGYDFTGWNMTAEEIQAELAKGNDVMVEAVWTRAIVYVTVNVNGGTINGESGAQCVAYSEVTVVAGAAASGQKFAYWTNGKGQVVSYDAEYKFFPAEDTALKANYVASDAEITYQAIVGLSADPTSDGEFINYTMTWDVPESVGKVTLAGLIIVNANDYNADTFYHGSGDSKLFDRALGSAQIMQKNTYAINKGSSYYDNTYYACTWVIYTDAKTGESVTVYSDMVEVTKLG